jgi:hypothetical protein
MTQAVCFRCGVIKFGAFCPCQECQTTPKTEDDLVISMAMTDHYFDMDTLKRFGESVRERGERPKLDPETRNNLLETIRSAGDMMSQLGDDLDDESPKPIHKKPWWKFW